jgi:hypothetical protein
MRCVVGSGVDGGKTAHQSVPCLLFFCLVHQGWGKKLKKKENKKNRIIKKIIRIFKRIFSLIQF